MDLRLLQLGDSALPIGGYSHSWGLEAAIEKGQVWDAFSCEQWMRSWLCHGIGPCEGIVVAAACRAAGRHDWSEIARANEMLWASVAPPSLRHASRDMGEQLLALAEAWPWGHATVENLRRSAKDGPDTNEWHHAPVFGALAAATETSPAEALAVYLHQAALGGIGAGVRAIPIGHSHGQQILARLHTDLESLA